MIRHLLKLVWHRRRANLLLALEMLASFLVVFPVAGFGIFLWRNTAQPVGYDWSDVWAVMIDSGPRSEGEEAARQAETLRRVAEAASTLPAVRSMATAEIAPLETANSVRSRDVSGATIVTHTNHVSDGFAEVMDLEIVAGRWFGPQDDAAAFTPVVIDRDLARTLWGADDPVGQSLPLNQNEDTEERVIGVVSQFKKDGELAGPGHYTFYRATLGEAPPHRLSRLVLEMEPGADAATEEQLVRRLQEVAPEWTFEVKTLEQLRATSSRMRLAPLLLGGTVALFLLSMVGLGLSGVLWQSVTQRTGELGLRRALGASRAAVRRQVLLEIVLLASLAVGAGLLVVVQLPLFELAGFLDGGVFAAALALAIAAILGLALLSGLYPSWLAMRVEPAEALHNE